MNRDGNNWDWSPAFQAAATTELAAVNRCVEMARHGLRREFPCQLPLVMTSPVDFHRPRDVTPVFYGCYDWHSAVHSHWLLLRAARLLPEAEWQPDVVQLLHEQFSADALSQEAKFLGAPERNGFERPYGLAWLLQLIAELREWNTQPASDWLPRFAELELIAVSRMQNWLESLSRPIRTGEHSQSAFALGLVADYARIAKNSSLLLAVQQAAERWYGQDRSLPIHLEPSAYDFLSPSLASADVMSRVLIDDEFSRWLDRAWPDDRVIDTTLSPVCVANPRDGKLAHFAGLNFSRAWMAASIAQALPTDHPWCHRFRQMALAHMTAGLPHLWSEEYAITHWVGSFALYAVTYRGFRSSTEPADL